jgi:putative mRNA 3-end processing factor
MRIGTDCFQSIRATGAQRIVITHGYTEALSRYLAENGVQTRIYHTQFSNRGEEESEGGRGYSD